VQCLIKEAHLVKFCVVTPRYTIAGVPLAQLRLARALAARGHEVDLLIGHIDSQYGAPHVAGVNVLNLVCPTVRRMFLPLRTYLSVARPDVVFSAEDHLNAIVLLAAIICASKAKISCSSRVTPFDTYSNVPFTKRWILKQLMRAVIWRANAATCVSKDMVEQYRRIFHRAPHICIYNIVDDRHSRLRSEEVADQEWFVRKDCPILIAAGRLAPWKGFSDLIHAVKYVSTRRRIRLLILGDGPLRSELEELIDSLGLRDTIRLCGYVENPLKFFTQADVFVLSSHVEGLPNVLVEAIMCGCTPVSTDCPTGPREVLQDGKYGYLVRVGDPVALASGIEQALDHPIPKSALAEAISPFTEEIVLERHFEVLGLNGIKGRDAAEVSA
jgi:glycosyltransferase involved in cell wall biosynthesis